MAHLNAETTGELWARIDVAPNYEVSSFGRVRRVAAFPVHLCGRVHRPKLCKCGRYAVRLYVGKTTIHPFVHQLVCAAFHGAKPSASHEVAHNDGNPKNNRAGNLRWATKSENYADRNAHGTHNKGERNGCAKLDAFAVTRVRELSLTMSSRSVASVMGISKSQVGNILRGEAWTSGA